MDILDRVEPFDIEVYRNFWEVRGETFSIRSDTFNEEIRYKTRVYLIKRILVGYNIKSYDMIILHHILFVNYDPTYIKQLNDTIIAQRSGIYDISYWNRFNFVDLIDLAKNANDDKRIGLKSIAGNMGLNIVESSISFDDDITDDNIHLHDEYLGNDVILTRALYEEFKGLIEMKLNIAETFGIDKYRALKSTKSKLASIVVKNGNKFVSDMTNYYQVPLQLKGLFDRYVDDAVKDYYYNTPLEDIKEIEFDDLYDNVVKFARGGEHSVHKSQKIFMTDDEGTLYHADFSSNYPFAMINYDFISRGVNKGLFTDLVYERMRMKKELKGNAKMQIVAESYKEVINSIYGNSGDKNNELFDPEMSLHVTITCQLLISSLAQYLFENGITICQCNTDGIICYVPNDKVEVYEKIIADVDRISGIELESDKLQRLYQWNVNNYIEVDDKGHIESKGRYVGNEARNRLFSTNYPIVERCIREYLCDDSSTRTIEQMVRDCDDLHAFTAVVKAGGTFDECYLGTKEEIVTSLHKINRIINVTDSNYIIYKRQIEKEKRDKIADQGAGVCVINKELSCYNINDFNIDYDFYVNRVEERINKLYEENDEI